MPKIQIATIMSTDAHLHKVENRCLAQDMIVNSPN
jgi:hypothetical protein